MATINKIHFLLLFFIIPLWASAQTRISGLVKDASSGELLIGATVWETGTTNGTTTNTNGYFTLYSGGKPIRVSYIGYQSVEIKNQDNQVMNVLLKPGRELEEIMVTGQRFQQFNTTTLSNKELLSIPAIGGKPDVLKTLQLMPGIQAQSEGTSLLNVRGGNPGENLYLIDQVPLIYVNHLGGFMSVFNPDMINAIEVYKGGFPAKYGGKLSSVMAITQREGNNKAWKGNLGIGVTDASFTVEGPLMKEKASLIVTGRKTLIDPLMLLASALSGGGDYYVFYGFHDINGKISYRPDTKNSFHLNFYQGDDYLKFWSKAVKETAEKASVNNAWGNWLLSGRWSRIVNERLFTNTIASVTSYRLKVAQHYSSKMPEDTLEFTGRYLSSVKDLSLRSDWQLKVLRNYTLEFGGKLTQLTNIPNSIYNSNSLHQAEVETIRSLEASAYVNNRFSLLNLLDAEIGLVAVHYSNKGYQGVAWEPRVNVNARLTPEHTLNFSFQRVNQFAHLLYTSGAIMYNEIWVPANEQLPPSASLQYSAGWKGSFAKGMIDVELNLYHKTLSQLATYKEGYSNLLGDGGWRTKIESAGTGLSRGLELLVRKNTGSWTGFAAYTLSKTTRRFEGINRGEAYPFTYDRPHVFSLNVNKQLNEQWKANLVWVYQTGLPYTPVIGRQYIPDGSSAYAEALIYGERNSDRMKNYHRLDLGFTREKINRKGRRTIWTYSVYNAYSRMNPNSYYYASSKKNSSTYDYEGNYQSIKLYQMSFFPIIPSVAYKVFF